METFLQDVRYALRTLSRSRMFALIAVACLALGIGVNTTIFSVVNAVLLRPFDFREPERLVVLEELNTQNGGRAGVAWPNLVDWRAQSISVLGYRGGPGSKPHARERGRARAARGQRDHVEPVLDARRVAGRRPTHARG
jgi:hypothetical protein